MRVIFSVKAENDLLEIGLNIAKDSPDRAESFIDELRDHCLRLSDFPRIGTSQSSLGNDVRRLVHGEYLVFYSVSSHLVQIECILHGRRDLNALFEDDPLSE